MTELEPAAVARAHRATEPLHSLVYFAPEVDDELTGVGLRPGRMCYFASRSAPMGAVVPAVTTATFYNFNPDVVARHLPRAWTLATVEDVLAARLRGVDRALRRLLGEEVIAGPELAELAELARDATTVLRPEGRPLYAAHAQLPWPTEPHLVLWHAATLLRESRGDGHIAVLTLSGLTGIEAIVTHTATGRGFREEAAKTLRGWSDEQWTAAKDGLKARGLLDDAGLTEAGQELRAALEADTDRLAAAPYEHLGPARTARLTELGKGFTRIAAGNGAFPDTVFATQR